MPDAAQLQPSPDDRIRLDIWLWRARFIKTRSEAARVVQAGKVRLTRGGQTRRVTKAHTALTPGDVLAFMRGSKLMHVQMLNAGTRRGPASEAQTLYSVVNDDAAISEQRDEKAFYSKTILTNAARRDKGSR